MTGASADRVLLSRRQFTAALAGGYALAACGRPGGPARPNEATAVAAAEAARPRTGRVVSATLIAQPATIDLSGPLAPTLAYGNTVPGPLIRAAVGDELAVTVTNRLDHATSVH